METEKPKTGFLEESAGVKSSNRIVFVLGSLYAMGMGAWIYAVTKDWVGMLTVVTTIAATFGAQKLVQKKIEKP